MINYLIGIMAADEFEDYLELRDPKVKEAIAASRRDYSVGKSRPVGKLLTELKKNRIKTL
jgi:hypothetical protein